MKYAKYCCYCCCVSHLSVPDKYIVQLSYIHAHAVSNTWRPHNVLITIRRARCTHIIFCPHNTLVRGYVCSGSTCFRTFNAARSSIAWDGVSYMGKRFETDHTDFAREKKTHTTPHTQPPYHTTKKERDSCDQHERVGRPLQRGHQKILWTVPRRPLLLLLLLAAAILASIRYPGTPRGATKKHHLEKDTRALHRRGIGIPAVDGE